MDLVGAMDALAEWAGHLENHKEGFIVFGCLVFLVIIALLAAFAHDNRLLWRREAMHVAEICLLRLQRDRSKLIIKAEPQAVVTWGLDAIKPVIDGDPDRISAMLGCTNPLAFGQWLSPSRAQSFEAAVEALKVHGTPFEMILQAKTGRHIEVDGLPVSGCAVLRLRDSSTQRQDLLDLARDHENLKVEAMGLRAMLDTLAQPIWLRDRAGKLSWVNEPYAFAVEASGSVDAVQRQVEFLEPLLRKDAAEALSRGDIFEARMPAVVAGQRRIFDIVETPLASGVLGYAADVSDLESVRSDLQRQMDSHVRTLDQLPTAVAIFDERQNLTFSNLAFSRLWRLDDAFLRNHPTDGEILDRLRDARLLPEQADYKSWKKTLHDAYHSLETSELVWYLPDGRTLRVVVTPNPQGGVTYLYEDVTTQFDLESSVTALTQVQSETLYFLNEGVAVFGADGRLKLCNPAFQSIWALTDRQLADAPHLDRIILDVQGLYADVGIWSQIKGAVGGVNADRRAQSFRMERHDGSIVDCALAPLPDGATLITFVDMTDSVRVERALKERAAALEQAAKLRDNFVHHVSYELRSPLTNVIGFSEMLVSGAAGPLNHRQQDYAGHVIRSSNALMAIIDDILDLASFDRGEMTLERAPTDILATIEAAAGGLQDRIAELKIALVLDVPGDVGTFPLDGKRLRQILYNLLSNAVGFSSEGQTVTVSARKSTSGLILSVRDEGRGIPVDLIDRVFERFETHTTGSRHRGPGLGLSIVRALVELHGGRIRIVSEEGHGTLVTCTFPNAENGADASEAA